jgi:Ca2+-transporting ATPase
METLKVIGSDGRSGGHKRGGSVATVSTQVGSHDEHDMEKGRQLNTVPSSQTAVTTPPLDADGKPIKLSRKERKALVKEEKEKAQISHLDPDKDTTDPTPFKEKPSRLAMLVDPKSLDDLEKIGGIAGLLAGLGVDRTKGLMGGNKEAVEVQESEKGTRGDSTAAVVRGDGPQWKADLEERRRVYGRNDLPERKSKSLLQLMWLAFKDKVLVRLTTPRLVPY